MRHTFGGILSGLGAYLNYQRHEHSPKRRLPIIEKLGSNMFIVKVTKASKLEGPYQLIHKSGMRILHGSDIEALRDFSVTLATHPLAGPALRTLPTDDTATALFAWEKFRKSIPKDAMMDIHRYKVAMTTPSSGKLSGISKQGLNAAQVKYAMQKLAAKAKRCNITPAMMREGMKVELEHRDVTRGGIEKTARIAAAHMCEHRDYYKLLKKYVES